MSAAKFTLRCPRGHETRADVPISECRRCGWRATPDAIDECRRTNRCTRPEPLHDGMRCGRRAVARYDTWNGTDVLRCAQHDRLIGTELARAMGPRTALGPQP